MSTVKRPQFVYCSWKCNTMFPALQNVTGRVQPNVATNEQLYKNYVICHFIVLIFNFHELKCWEIHTSFNTINFFFSTLNVSNIQNPPAQNIQNYSGSYQKFSRIQNPTSINQDISISPRRNWDSN